MTPVEHSKSISPDSPLRDWVALKEDGDIPEATFKRLAEHPLYDAIAREFMQGSMALAASDSRVDDIFKDMGRYGAAIWAVYLHFTGGLTLPRLKEICARSGVLSPGRARALLIYLQLLGYVKKLPKSEPGPARYAPSDALLQALKAHARLGLAAMTAVDPAFQIVLDHFDEPAVFSNLYREIRRRRFQFGRGDRQSAAHLADLSHAERRNAVAVLPSSGRGRCAG